MNGKFKIGFWNYTDCNILDPEQSISDWVELGLNGAMSSNYRSEKDKGYILSCLDVAQRKGVKITVCDYRTNWKNYIEKGETAFIEDVKNAVKDFGSHPAFEAFHVGDEPDKDTWEAMLKATKIVNEYSTAFVNYFPFFDEEFEERVGVNHDGYKKILTEAVKSTGLNVMAYDCYVQCLEVDREVGIHSYFYNLNKFYAVAKECGVPLVPSLLCVGHWHFRVPNEDDLRWQINTAVAHGAKGIMWFYIYARFLESSYRNSPFDLYYKKTETYDRLSRQNRIFADHYADKISKSTLQKVYHFRKAYGDTPLYFDGCIKDLDVREKFGVPLIISQFADGEKDYIVVVNNSQTTSAKITVTYKGKFMVEWLAPGQLAIWE